MITPAYTKMTTNYLHGRGRICLLRSRKPYEKDCDGNYYIKRRVRIDA